MPTYEYQCDACQHNFDEFQSFSDKPLKKCPKCKKPKLRRVFGTGAAVLFKGSGFYQTDYRSESYKAAAKADESAKNGSAPKTDSKSDTAKSEPAAAKSESGGAASANGKGGEKSAKNPKSAT
jgi:putative FmdB family regulatory protein